VDGVRARLLAERAIAQSQLDDLGADVADLMAAAEGSNGDDEHDPEGATIAFERAQTQALAEVMRRRVAELDAALDRLEEGQYGVCAACGQPIAVERLAARPSATRCVACAAG
jgi:RNA polymerase-binding transcription factor DksA